MLALYVLVHQCDGDAMVIVPFYYLTCFQHFANLCKMQFKFDLNIISSFSEIICLLIVNTNYDFYSVFRREELKWICAMQGNKLSWKTYLGGIGGLTLISKWCAYRPKMILKWSQMVPPTSPSPSRLKQICREANNNRFDGFLCFRKNYERGNNICAAGVFIFFK